MPTHNRPQELKQIHFTRLKNLVNLTISFQGSPITGIFGVNGSGKSTILHALACIYKPSPDSSRKNFKFPQFFIPTTLDLWNNSEFKVDYDIIQGANMVPDSRTYYKSQDRWKPRYDSRPAREVFYIGINSCVPDMEIESRTSRIPLLKEEYQDAAVAQKIKDALSFIMNRAYDNFVNYWNERKTYKGLKYGAIEYPSLYMGAGEQRLIKFLETLYTIPDYSLVLVDELDLTLHTDALHRLMKKLHEECILRYIQIIFTSHREELLDCEIINLRYLLPDANGSTSVCLERTTPECIRCLTGVSPKPLDIFVEDELAEALVRKVLRNNQVEQHCRIIQIGSYENAYPIGAGLVIRNNNLDNTLIVLDGDVDISNAEKIQRINKVITGTDPRSQQRRNTLLSMIKQFNLIAPIKPEQFISSELSLLDDHIHPLIPLIKNVGVVGDHHDLLIIPIQNSGMQEQVALDSIADLMSRQPSWNNYIQQINDWVTNRKLQLGL